MYKLILITVLSNGEITATDSGEFLSIDRCFEGRENILVERRAWNGYLEAGSQAICVEIPPDVADTYTEVPSEEKKLSEPAIIPFDKLPEEPKTFTVK